MISTESRPYIEASVPVLREHGVAITRTFYRNMFQAHPELTNLFNMGNQASGAQQQSLAAAVFAYAANIDNPAALGPVVERIVHKHASVGITAEHYPIVGRHLLGAIQETLGEAATPALLSAWAEAYGSLARLFIETEKKLYASVGTTPGALHPMRVVAVRQESADVKSITMVPADGDPLPPFRPGQYVSVAVALDADRRQMRQYSLSDSPNAKHLRISVKRERADVSRPDGMVSNWIHAHVVPGSVLHLTHPFGEFQPDAESEHPIVLLSAGVGITPMISTLNRIAQTRPDRRVLFVHAARDLAHHSHREDLVAAQKRMPNLRLITFYESMDAQDHESVPGELALGLMDATRLPAWPRTETDVYLCGPTAFMRAQWSSLIAAGVPVSRIHREVFGPELLDSLH